MAVGEYTSKFVWMRLQLVSNEPGVGGHVLRVLLVLLDEQVDCEFNRLTLVRVQRLLDLV